MRWLRTLAAGVGAVALSLAVVPGFAGGPQTSLVAEDPVNWTPRVQNGKVNASATVGDMTVAVGDFTRVREARTRRLRMRTDIFAFDSTGRVSTTFVPKVNGSEIFDVVPAGDGRTVYIGGLFTQVNGVKRSRVARINVDTGKVVSRFRGPTFNRKVNSLHLANGRLYVGGWFRRVGGHRHTALAALNPVTGADTRHLDLTFTEVWNNRRDRRTGKIIKSVVGIEEFTMTPDGTKLVAIGNFRKVEGRARAQIVMIDTSGARAKLDSWSTRRFNFTCSKSYDTYMWGVDFAPDGSYFVVGTTGAYSGGVGSGTLCDTVSRWETHRSGWRQQPTWVDYMGGDTVTEVEATNHAIYVGGHFRWANNPYVADALGPGAVRRAGLAAFDPRNGLPLSWNPSRERGWGVWGFESTPQGLWVGHDTKVIGGEPRGRLALLPVVGGATPPPDNTGSLPGTAYRLEDDGSVLQSGLTESGAGGETTAVDGGVDWSGVRGAFMVDGRLFTGWDDGTFTWRPYNGRTFGVPRDIDLHDLTKFSSELARVGAMWFDRETGRLYFTLDGKNALFYRYFTPESRTVGAVRFTVAGSSEAPIDWRTVTGGFLADGRLYLGTVDGSLSSALWSQDGVVAATPESVSGPTVDGTDWSSPGLFLYAAE